MGLGRGWRTDGPIPWGQPGGQADRSGRGDRRGWSCRTGGSPRFGQARGPGRSRCRTLPAGGPGSDGPAGRHVLWTRTRQGELTLVALVGRLTWDAEIGQLPNDRRIPRLRFTLAVDRDYEVGGETPTDFWPVDVVREYGTWLAPFLTRGRAVLAHGCL